MKNGLLFFIYLVLIYLLGIINRCNSRKLTIAIAKNELRCIGEYLTQTLTMFSIEGEKTIKNIKLIDSQGSVAHKKEDQRIIKFAFNPKESGNHQLCFISDTSNKITFEILTGIDAKDYSYIAKKSNLDRMELNLKKLDDAVNYVIKEFNTIISTEHSDTHKELSNKTINYSLITLSFIITLGIVQSFFLSIYVNRKKII